MTVVTTFLTNNYNAQTTITPNLYKVNSQVVVNRYNVTINPLGQKGDSGDSFLFKISGEAIPSHTPIAIVDNLAYKFDASNLDHTFAFVGFSVNGTNVGENCKIQQLGEIELAGWGLIPNQHYLADYNGLLAVENNSFDKFTKVIGYATTSNSLQIIKDSLTINK